MASTKTVLRDQLFAPDVQPTKAKPFPFTKEEHDELRRQLDQLLASSWLSPSLSPLTFPVLFVRLKPDNLVKVSVSLLINSIMLTMI
jgi:hypothetical protein